MNCLRIVLQNLKALVLRFDLFAAAPTFRVRQEPAYETLGCGFFSLVMIFTFAGIFATQIIDVLTKAEVTASVNLDVRFYIIFRTNLNLLRKSQELILP